MNKENQKKIILDRTLPGRLTAKRMGKLGGRPKKLHKEKIVLARKLYDDPNNKVKSICKVLGISKPTFYAYLYRRHKKMIHKKIFSTDQLSTRFKKFENSQPLHL